MQIRSNLINICFVTAEIARSDFENEIWRRAQTIFLENYWSGATAPPERRATARILWTENSLFVRFDCPQGEPYVVGENPNTEAETDELWNRDVCEIFLSSEADEPKNYFEFEAAPTGEWLDFEINFVGDKRETNRAYDSGMKTAARMSEDEFTIVIELDWLKAFGKKPQKDEIWRANLFRCIGEPGERRGYVAWQPTFTEKPNFHVPSVFGFLQFKREI
jgi:alpha-galactosidase